jgi:hypothetical protein
VRHAILEQWRQLRALGLMGLVLEVMSTHVQEWRKSDLGCEQDAVSSLHGFRWSHRLLPQDVAIRVLF